MNKQAWRWGRSGVVVGRIVKAAADGAEERLWVNAQLPPEGERAHFGLRVEILCWYGRLRAMKAALDVVGAHFHADSLLVAMRRREDFTRLLLYTSAREALVQERYLGVRSVLRPTAIGLRLAYEPAWEALSALLDPAHPAAEAIGAAP